VGFWGRGRWWGCSMRGCGVGVRGVGGKLADGWELIV
jgi:hypothetical protein